MKKILVLCLGVLLSSLVLAQSAAQFESKPPSPNPISDFALVNKVCMGPLDNPPPFQRAYSGTYGSLSNTVDYLDYVQGSTNLVRINMRLDNGTWTTGEFELAGQEREKIVPLFRPGSVTPVGLVKICSPTFSQNGSTLCTNFHIRMVSDGHVLIPRGYGQGFQRFEELGAMSGGGSSLPCIGG